MPLFFTADGKLNKSLEANLGVKYEEVPDVFNSALVLSKLLAAFGVEEMGELDPSSNTIMLGLYVSL